MQLSPSTTSTGAEDRRVGFQREDQLGQSVIQCPLAVFVLVTIHRSIRVIVIVKYHMSSESTSTDDFISSRYHNVRSDAAMHMSQKKNRVMSCVLPRMPRQAPYIDAVTVRSYSLCTVQIGQALHASHRSQHVSGCTVPQLKDLDSSDIRKHSQDAVDGRTGVLHVPGPQQGEVHALQLQDDVDAVKRDTFGRRLIWTEQVTGMGLRAVGPDCVNQNANALQLQEFLRPQHAQNWSFNQRVVVQNASQAGVTLLELVESIVVLVQFRRRRSFDVLQQNLSVRAKDGLQGDGMQAEGNTQVEEEAAVHFAQRWCSQLASADRTRTLCQ